MRGHSSIERVMSMLAWVSLAIALLLATVVFFATLSGEQGGREIFGRRLLIVASDSMSRSSTGEEEEIFFDAGDLVVIKGELDPAKLSAGEVICFVSHSPESHGKILTHKIREVKYSAGGELLGFVTYGIHTGKNDTTVVKPDTVIGKYAFKIPKLGKAFSFLKTPRGYFISILLPAVLLIIFFSEKIGKTLGKREMERRCGEEIEMLRHRLEELEGGGSKKTDHT